MRHGDGGIIGGMAALLVELYALGGRHTPYTSLAGRQLPAT